MIFNDVALGSLVWIFLPLLFSLDGSLSATGRQNLSVEASKLCVSLLSTYNTKIGHSDSFVNRENGEKGGIRTHDCTVLQTVPFDHSGT